MDKTQSKEDLFPGIAGYKPNPKKPCPHCHQSQGMCDECGHCRIHCGTCGRSKRSWKCLHSRRCICKSFDYWVDQCGLSPSAAERVLEAEREALKSDDPPEVLDLFPNPNQIDPRLAWKNVRASNGVATAENELFDADQAVQKAQAFLAAGSGSQEDVAAAKDQQADCLTKVAEKTLIAQKLIEETKEALQAAKDLKASTVLLSLRYLENFRCKRRRENGCDSLEPPIKKAMASVDTHSG